MATLEQTLKRISTYDAQYGDIESCENIMKDLFAFLGGQPGEVVLVENGTPFERQKVLLNGVKAGWLTKFMSVRPGAADIGAHQSHIGDVCSLALATNDIALRHATDVLSYRKGRDNWLVEAVEKLKDPDVFAFTGTFNAPAKAKELDDEFYLSKKVSCNFALMPRRRLQESWHDIAGDFIRSGFRDRSTLSERGVRHIKYLEEIGVEQLLAKKDWHAWVRRESMDWRLFHVAGHNDELIRLRERFLAGDGVEQFLNSGDVLMTEENQYRQRYFGLPPDAGPSLFKRIRIAVGASPLGPIYRSVLRRNAEPVPEPPTVADHVPDPSSRLGDTALIVFVDDPDAFATELPRFMDQMGERPLQVLAIVSATDQAADIAWKVHEQNLVDRLLLSRHLTGGVHLGMDMLVDNGMFASAHSPHYVVCLASALESLPNWLRDLPSGTTRAQHPSGVPQEKATMLMGARLDLMAEVERAIGPDALCPALGRYSELR